MAEIPRVLNVLLLDADGKRIAVKYFDGDMTTVASQMAYERQVFQKTSRTNARGEAEIAILDKHLVVRGAEHENPTPHTRIERGQALTLPPSLDTRWSFQTERTPSSCVIPE